MCCARMECEQLQYEGVLTPNWPRGPLPQSMPPRLGFHHPLGLRPPAIPFGPQRPPMVSVVAPLFWGLTRPYMENINLVINFCLFIIATYYILLSVHVFN